MKYYSTFGQGQYNSLLANYFITFIDPPEGETSVRYFLHEAFGAKWSFIYSEKEFDKQPALYELTNLGIVKWDNENQWRIEG